MCIRTTVSPFFTTIFSDASTLDGDPLPEGAVVTVRAPDGMVCGVAGVRDAGSYGPLHVYRDDASTSEDEAAAIGETMRVFVNDMPSGQTFVYANDNAMTRVDLAAATVLPLSLEGRLHLISLPVMRRIRLWLTS